MIRENEMKRLLILAVAVFVAGKAISLAAADARVRPNFLFIYTDDQRYDAMGVVQKEQGAQGRFPWFQTPNMDRLATEGVRFRNAFVVNSLCAPSRAVNLTGRYNHFNGIASNFRPFPLDNVTHATLLRRAGYATGYIGKWHMDSQRERPGFDFHASFLGHARYVDPVIVVQGKDTPSSGWVDDLSTRYAIDFMRQQQGSGKPWSLVVGFKSPHGPCEPPLRAKQRFAGEQARAVPNLNSRAPYMGNRAKPPAPAVPGETVPVNLDYFRCISAADDCLGELLDALDEMKIADNTVVIYTSDNGYYLGEHGLGDKRSAYDESLRVPFLVRFPNLPGFKRGQVVDEMVLNLDLAPSLLDMAGETVPAEMQGRSWRPLLAGENVAWRESWFYEYFAEKQVNSRVPDITAVRTKDAKLIRYPGHDEWTELFDLKADPFETRNLYSSAAKTDLQTRLEAEHDRLAKELGYRVPDYVDRPAWWGLPDGPDTKPDARPALKLDFDFSQPAGSRIADRSEFHNDGRIVNGRIGAGREGRPALQLDGSGYVEVPNSPSLNPAGKPWTIEVTVRPERPDGVIVARGGRSHGYAIWLKDGKPMFTVVTDGKATTVAGPQAFTDWTTLVGIITIEPKAVLYVDGHQAGAAALADFIAADPNDLMQIGADLGSPLLEAPPPKFAGQIERLKIYSGQADSR